MPRLPKSCTAYKLAGPFSSRHRIIDTHGATHWVVVVGDQMIDDSGEVVGTEGFYIDVTDGLQSDITTETSRILKSRSIIDQAKGVLMVAYGSTMRGPSRF